jgi:hypothetical protein
LGGDAPRRSTSGFQELESRPGHTQRKAGVSGRYKRRPAGPDRYVVKNEIIRAIIVQSLSKQLSGKDEKQPSEGAEKIG